MKAQAIVTVCAALTLIACSPDSSASDTASGSTQTSAGAAPSSAASTAPASTPSPTPTYAAPEDIASALLHKPSELREDYSILSRCADGVWRKGPGTCGIASLNVSMIAFGTEQDIEFALGQVSLPLSSQIQALVDRTLVVMEAAQAADDSVSECERDGACDDAYRLMEAASADVVQVLKEWDAYRR